MQNASKEERQSWRQEEDTLIVELVKMHGTKKWTLIADVLKEKVSNSRRNGKQCRERWHNHLDPMVRKSPWNETEEFVFIEAHKIHGNKWAEIAKMIPGRTDNSIKNHFYSTLRKLISRVQKDEIPPELKFDNQMRLHMTYLSKYLKSLIRDNIDKQLLIDEEAAGALNSSSADLYVIKKLKESEITIQKIDEYLQRVFSMLKATASQAEQPQHQNQASGNESIYQQKQRIPSKLEDNVQFSCEPIQMEATQMQCIDQKQDQNPRPIFQVQKEEVKTASIKILSEELSYPLELTSTQQQKQFIDKDMIDTDFNMFLNAGDALLEDKLGYLSAQLLKDYSQAKAIELKDTANISNEKNQRNNQIHRSRSRGERRSDAHDNAFLHQSAKNKDKQNLVIDVQELEESQDIQRVPEPSPQIDGPLPMSNQSEKLQLNQSEQNQAKEKPGKPNLKIQVPNQSPRPFAPPQQQPRVIIIEVDMDEFTQQAGHEAQEIVIQGRIPAAANSYNQQTSSLYQFSSSPQDGINNRFISHQNGSQVTNSTVTSSNRAQDSAGFQYRCQFGTNNSLQFKPSIIIQGQSPQTPSQIQKQNPSAHTFIQANQLNCMQNVPIINSDENDQMNKVSLLLSSLKRIEESSQQQTQVAMNEEKDQDQANKGDSDNHRNQIIQHQEQEGPMKIVESVSHEPSQLHTVSHNNQDNGANGQNKLQYFPIQVSPLSSHFQSLASTFQFPANFNQVQPGRGNMQPPYALPQGTFQYVQQQNFGGNDRNFLQPSLSHSTIFRQLQQSLASVQSQIFAPSPRFAPQFRLSPPGSAAGNGPTRRHSSNLQISGLQVPQAQQSQQHHQLFSPPLVLQRQGSNQTGYTPSSMIDPQGNQNARYFPQQVSMNEGIMNQFNSSVTARSPQIIFPNQNTGMNLQNYQQAHPQASQLNQEPKSNLE